jgi:hypothetical protein
MTDVQSGGARKLEAVRTIISNREWELAECDSPIKTGAFRYIIDTYHKYMKYKDTCNRRINWLVYYRGRIVGAFGINSAILNLSPRDAFIGWTKEQRLKHLNNLANNYRFCMIKEGLPTSQLLSVACKVAQKRWREKYGDRLVLIESLVKPPFTGKVYQSSGWIFIGKTKGFSFSKAPLASWKKEKSARGELARNDPDKAIKKYAVGRERYHINQSEPKLVFIRPLSADYKQILLR